jgi:hypothetical protein
VHLAFLDWKDEGILHMKTIKELVSDVVDEELDMDSEGESGLGIAGQSASETSSDEEIVRVKVTLVMLLLNGWKVVNKGSGGPRGGTQASAPLPDF